MNLKDEMMKQFQDVDVIKTKEQITEDIQYLMKQGQRYICYEARFLTEEIKKSVEDDGFTVTPYSDIHSDKQGLELIKISW
ncbi:hypothetical protein [Vagococcus carniphilus]|uniref:hypothetical protein n=1 Tax=Vagococcus carniphilus TaxID=218144 RepID=UPI0028904A77|nr:hypothetical protein [Vagococcus carniphilus]MDT2864684.1 hypothetical protein [Vagococcus carniphilus]